MIYEHVYRNCSFSLNVDISDAAYSMRNELGRIKTFLPTNELVEDERNEDLKKESMELSWSVKGDLLEKKDVCSYAFNNTGERYSYLIPHTVSYRGSTIPSRPVPPYFFFFLYRPVPRRDGTVRCGTIFIPHTVSLWLDVRIFAQKV